jgi:hypothetical protein
MMDPTTSSKQPSLAVLPIDALEQTLRDLHIDIDAQSFIEKVTSQPSRSAPTQEDAHPAAGGQHSVLPLLSTSRFSTPLVTLQLDSLSMAMEELGLRNSAVTLMKTAQLAELISMPEPTPEGRQALLERKPYSL